MPAAEEDESQPEDEAARLLPGGDELSEVYGEAAVGSLADRCLGLLDSAAAMN